MSDMPPREPPPGQADSDLSADRVKLAARLDALKVSRAAETEPDRAGSMKGMAEGLKIASEFIAGVVVGVAIGYGIDQLFGTSPFGLIVFLLLGFAAGVLNVIRSAGRRPTVP